MVLVITVLLNLKLTRDTINQGLNESEYQVTCIRFAPNDPTQNPIEDIWLHAKNFIREFYHLCKSFSHVKKLFELVTHHQVFDFPKISMYGSFFSQLLHGLLYERILAERYRNRRRRFGLRFNLIAAIINFEIALCS